MSSAPLAKQVVWRAAPHKSSRLDGLVAVALCVNAAVIGASTYAPDVAAFDVVNAAFLAAFAVEAVVRWRMAGSTRRYLADGWNRFDLVVLAASLIPVYGPAAQIVRLARLAKLGRNMGELRVMGSALRKALPGIASLLAATVLLLFMFGVAGTVLFPGDPHYRNAGTAMLFLFTMLGLEGLPDVMDAAVAETLWAVPFYISFAVLASYIVFNLFISIVLAAMESARGDAKEPSPDLSRRLADAEAAIAEARAAL